MNKEIINFVSSSMNVETMGKMIPDFIKITIHYHVFYQPENRCFISGQIINNTPGFHEFLNKYPGVIFVFVVETKLETPSLN
jgi:hypothetical protein